MRAVESGHTPGCDPFQTRGHDPNFVTAPTFQTAAEKYDWMNKIQTVGKMVEFKRTDPMHVKYDVFIVR